MNKRASSIRLLTVTALLTAMNVVMSSSLLSVPVPGGHMYLNDVIIVAAAVLLPPLPAFAVGGVGAFLGDLLFYPAPMFVSLVTHGVQALAVSLCTRRLWPGDRRAGSLAGALIGWAVAVLGYTLGRAYLYSTPQYALLKLPFQILQDAVGSALGLALCWPCGLAGLFRRQFGDL